MTVGLYLFTPLVGKFDEKYVLDATAGCDGLSDLAPWCEHPTREERHIMYRSSRKRVEEEESFFSLVKTFGTNELPSTHTFSSSSSLLASFCRLQEEEVKSELRILLSFPWRAICLLFCLQWAIRTNLFLLRQHSHHDRRCLFETNDGVEQFSVERRTIVGVWYIVVLFLRLWLACLLTCSLLSLSLFMFWWCRRRKLNSNLLV